ncbi:unnamed protein product [Ambrosiozyma monospora]|uniref:Unnamed protein product n=1 Tax=Ambrosiozyma monospora TaxID=43982 RepID=A0ACB5T6B3_AMBMO|nr:unnamed protein product [Ambrosiozyma monospora]
MAGLDMALAGVTSSSSSGRTTATNNRDSLSTTDSSITSRSGSGSGPQLVANDIRQNTTEPSTTSRTFGNHSRTAPSSATTLKFENETSVLSEHLRILATKEMEILEIKQEIDNLNGRKKVLEFELQDLKIKVEQQLVRQLTQQNLAANNKLCHRHTMSSIDTTGNVTPFDRHVPKSPRSLKRGSVQQATGMFVDPLLDGGTYHISPSPEPESNGASGSYNHQQRHQRSATTVVGSPYADYTPQSLHQHGKRQSWLAKPLNFFQQFDNMIYQEFEKLNLPGLGDEQQSQEMDNYGSHDDDSSNGKREINEPIKALAGLTGGSTGVNNGEVIQSVSNSLWSFVNEVKSNLLNDPSDFNNNTASHQQQQETGNKMRPMRARAPSVSSRQTYGQYTVNKHHKRKNSSIAKSQPQAHLLDTDDLQITKDKSPKSTNHLKLSKKPSSSPFRAKKNENVITSDENATSEEDEFSTSSKKTLHKKASLILSNCDDSNSTITETTSQSINKKHSFLNIKKNTENIDKTQNERKPSVELTNFDKVDESDLWDDENLIDI